MKRLIASGLAAFAFVTSITGVSADPIPVGAICRQSVCVTGDDARTRIEVEQAKGVLFDPEVVDAAVSLPTGTYVAGPYPWGLPNAKKPKAVSCQGLPTDVGLDLLCGKPTAVAPTIQSGSLSLIRVGAREFMVTREGQEIGLARSAPGAGGRDDVLIVVKLWAADADGQPVFGGDFDPGMTTAFSWDSRSSSYLMDWSDPAQNQARWDFASRGQ